MARPAPAAARAVQVLDLLVTHPTERFTLSELVRRTGMSLGSAHAVLAVLESSGHVTRHPPHAYTLSPALVVAGVVALEHQPGIDAARSLIGALAEELGTETALTARTSDEIIFIARAGEPTPNGPAIREGERVPLVPPLRAPCSWRTPPIGRSTTGWRARPEATPTPSSAAATPSNRSAPRLRRHRRVRCAEAARRSGPSSSPTTPVAPTSTPTSPTCWPLWPRRSTRCSTSRPTGCSTSASSPLPSSAPTSTVIAAITATGFPSGLPTSAIVDTGPQGPRLRRRRHPPRRWPPPHLSPAATEQRCRGTV